MNINKARAILPFCGVRSRLDNGRIASVSCPCSPLWDASKKRSTGRYAVVSLNRDGARVTCSCRHFVIGSDSDEGTPCPAEANGNLCYHVLAALLIVAEEGGAVLHFKQGEGCNPVSVLYGPRSYPFGFTVKQQRQQQPAPVPQQRQQQQRNELAPPSRQRKQRPKENSCDRCGCAMPDDPINSYCGPCIDILYPDPPAVSQARYLASGS